MANLFEPPTKMTLPLSKGSDLYVAFTYMPGQVDENGQPALDENGRQVYAEADYPPGSTVTMTIDTTPPLEIKATIDGSAATCWEQSEVVDTVKSGKPWRVVIGFSNGTNKVLCNGIVRRKDGY